MGAAILAQYEAFDDKYNQMMEYLSAEGGYWKDNDKWYMDVDSFMGAGIHVPNPRHWLLADFGSYKEGRLKNEMKYFLLHSMKDVIVEALSSLKILNYDIVKMLLDKLNYCKLIHYSSYIVS